MHHIFGYMFDADDVRNKVMRFLKQALNDRKEYEYSNRFFMRYNKLSILFLLIMRN